MPERAEQKKPSLSETSSVIRQHALNGLLVQADSAMSLMLAVFLVGPTWTFILLWPIAWFGFERLFSAVMSFIGIDKKLKPLPRDFRARVQALLPVPRNVIFLRGRGNDCESRSFWLVHFILIPQGFEYDLDAPRNQGWILHELGHGSFFDFLSITLLQFASLLFVTAIFWPFAILLNPELTPVRPEDAEIAFPMAVMAALCLANLIGVYHRREKNADLFAFSKNPAFTLAFLKRRNLISKSLTTPWHDWESRLMNAVLHPTFKERLNFLVGESTSHRSTLLFVSIPIGACAVTLPVLSVLVPALTIDAAFNGSDIVKPAICSLLSFAGFIQIAGFINAFFYNGNVVGKSEKWLVILGLLIGAEICISSFMLFPKFVPSIEGVEAFIYFEPSQDLSMAMVGILIGFVPFLLSLRLHRQFKVQTVLNGYLFPLYLIVGYSIVGTLKLNIADNLSLQTNLLFVMAAVLIMPFVVFGIELSLRSTVRVFQKAVPSKQQNTK